jgi:hypothetical protein
MMMSPKSASGNFDQSKHHGYAKPGTPEAPNKFGTRQPGTWGGYYLTVFLIHAIKSGQKRQNILKIQGASPISST